MPSEACCLVRLPPQPLHAGLCGAAQPQSRHLLLPLLQLLRPLVLLLLLLPSLLLLGLVRLVLLHHGPCDAAWAACPPPLLQPLLLLLLLLLLRLLLSLLD